MLVIAAALLTHVGRMLLTSPGAAGSPETAPPRAWSANVPLVVGLLACAGLGVTLGPLAPVLQAAAATLGAP